MTSVLTPPDRRFHRRYPLRLPMRYRAANAPFRAGWKRGGVFNMSAGGILIEIPGPVAVGARLELAMEWTGLYHGCETMRLFLAAQVTRTGPHGTALRILSARFRDASPARVGRERAEKNLAVA